MLLIDEVAQGHDHRKTDVVFRVGAEVGLYEAPHRFALVGAEPPAEAVADGPVVDPGDETGDPFELLLDRACGISDDKAFDQPLLEITYLEAVEECAPVAAGDAPGDFPQKGNTNAEQLPDAGYERCRKLPVAGVGECEQLFAEGHRTGGIIRCVLPCGSSRRRTPRSRSRRRCCLPWCSRRSGCGCNRSAAGAPPRPVHRRRRRSGSGFSCPDGRSCVWTPMRSIVPVWP